MRATLILIAGLLLPAASSSAQALKLVGTPTRTWASPSLPVQSGESVAMEMLLMPGTDMTAVRADIVQVAGTVAAPLDTTVTITPSPRDERLAVVSFTAPTVTRITRLQLRLTDHTRWPLVVFPPDGKDESHPDLSELFKSTRLQLLVCGRSGELRDYLRAQNLKFEDLGADPPRRLRADEILIGEISKTEDWERLASPDAGGFLIASVDDPSLLPGIHTTRRDSGIVSKVTLPLFPLLSDNPQARETLFQLLLGALTAADRQ